MPAQKRSHETSEDDPLQRNHNHHEQTPEDGDESDRSPSSSSGDRDEFVVVKLAEIRKEVQCPICLGIIRKTRTVMECLHRFCRECIDKSMRLGNNECPACRTHCASRRSLRDDPNYDSLIAAIYPDIDKYEEEELAFHEEEKARNKQIQASIAQTIRRQSEALGRKRTTAKATAAAFVRRSQGSYRRRRNYRAVELQGSDDDEVANGNDGGKDSSSADERCTEVKPKRPKRWGGARFSQPSSAAASADGGGDENDSEVNRESMGASVGLVGSSERLAWGKGGMRSHTRYGSVSGGNGKNARNSRLSKLLDYFRNLDENDDENEIRNFNQCNGAPFIHGLSVAAEFMRSLQIFLDSYLPLELAYTSDMIGSIFCCCLFQLAIQLMLVSFDEQKIPSLQRPYLCCRPTSSVRHLCQYIALQTQLQPDEVEILVVKEQCSKLNSSTTTNVPISDSSIVDACKDGVQILEAQETLGGLQAICNSNSGHIILAYRQKLTA